MNFNRKRIKEKRNSDGERETEEADEEKGEEADWEGGKNGEIAEEVGEEKGEETKFPLHTQVLMLVFIESQISM